MTPVYTCQKPPTILSKSIFLAGPTARVQPGESAPPSWRAEALSYLESQGYEGVVFVPEYAPDFDHSNLQYSEQVDWETECLKMSDVILIWVPRDLEKLPAFTTNIEFGTWLSSWKVVYGRPEDSPKNEYLDYKYKEFTKRDPQASLEASLGEALELIGEGAPREGGQTQVPLLIWNTSMFQDWHQDLTSCGNRLDGAEVLWVFKPLKMKSAFAWILKVKVWVAKEGRHKENEFVFSRRNTVSVVLTAPPKGSGSTPWDQEVILVREFRSPVSNSVGFVHELPGGSSPTEGTDPAETILEEIWEEVGLRVSPKRIRILGEKQLLATLSSHKTMLFTCQLNQGEFDQMVKRAKDGSSLGVLGESEITYVEILTLRQVLESDLVDWSNLGMIFAAIVGSPS